MIAQDNSSVSPEQRFASLYRPEALGIYALFLINGIACALLLPVLSTFLAKELGVRPLLVGLPFAGVAIAGLAYNHFIGHWSDSLKDRRLLVASLCVVGTIACGLLVFETSYLLVAATIAFLLSLAMVSFPQIVAYSLEYGVAAIPSERVPLFNAVMRAQIAIAWVVGPPVGFLLVSTFNFQVMFAITAAMFFVVACLSFKLLPPLAKAQGTKKIPKTESALGLSKAQKINLLFCLIGFSLMWGANNAYLISLPLHFQFNLGLDPKWAGVMMGTCAGLKIPFMLSAGHFAARISVLHMIRFAGLAALVVYAGVYFATDLWQLFALQIFNAIFIGVLAGIGISLVQDLLPGRAGFASSLYSNTGHVGNLSSSILVATVADVHGYGAMFAVNGLMILLALLAFHRVRLTA